MKQPCGWILARNDGIYDFTDYDLEPTDKNQEWAEKNGHKYLAIYDESQDFE